MSTAIEQKAIRYLLKTFRSPKYRFACLGPGDAELHLIDKQKKRRLRIELKASAAKYKRPSNIFSNLVFSHANEVKLFRGKRSKIVRIFMGNRPPRVFLVGAGILAKGAQFEREDRFVLRGAKSYKGLRPLQ